MQQLILHYYNQSTGTVFFSKLKKYMPILPKTLVFCCFFSPRVEKRSRTPPGAVRLVARHSSHPPCEGREKGQHCPQGPNARGGERLSFFSAVRAPTQPPPDVKVEHKKKHLQGGLLNPPCPRRAPLLCFLQSLFLVLEPCQPAMHRP